MSPKPQGEIRQSQLITTFGPGSMLDLPDHSVLVAGLNFWTQGGEVISEPRLCRKAAKVLDVPTIELRTPPAADDDPSAPLKGITGFQFPEWFITEDLEKGGSSRSRILVHRKSLTKGKYIDRDKNKRPVVPVRFVRACRSGHIADIDWYSFVHNGKSACAQQQRLLFIDERGTLRGLLNGIPLNISTESSIVGMQVEKKTRNRRSIAEKLEIIEAASTPGLSVRLVAAIYGVTPNQIYAWRKSVIHNKESGALPSA